jgi:hypothetical protein
MKRSNLLLLTLLILSLTGSARAELKAIKHRGGVSVVQTDLIIWVQPFNPDSSDYGPVTEIRLRTGEPGRAAAAGGQGGFLSGGGNATAVATADLQLLIRADVWSVLEQLGIKVPAETAPAEVERPAKSK